MKIGEFFIQLGVNADNKTLKEFIGGLGDMQIGALANIASIGALTAELVKIGIEATNAAVGFQMFSNQTGLSWQELQRWQIAAQQANVSTEAVASSVTALQRQMAEIRLGKGNIAPFQMLGISPTGTAFDVLNQLRDRIKGMDPAMATNFISQMGINPEMINLLKLTDTEFYRLSKTVRGMTTDQEQQFLRTKQSVVQMGMAFKNLGMDVVSHFLTAFEKFIQYINRVPGDMRLLIASLGLLAAALFPLQALIVGILLLFDDLAVYFTGGDSLTGRFIDGIKKMGEELKHAFSIPSLANFTNLLASQGGLGPLGAVASGAMAGAKAISNNFHISVSGMGSATDIAQEVIRQINVHFSHSEQQLDNQGT